MHAIKNGCSIKAILLLCNGCNTPFAEGQRVVDAGSFCIRCKRYIERVFCCIICCTKWKKRKKYVGLMRSYHESFKFDGFFAAPPPDAVLLPSPGCNQATDLTPPRLT